MCGRIYGIIHSKKQIIRQQSSYLQQHKVLQEEDEILVQEYGENHWKVRGYRFLHLHSVIIALAILMIVDIILLVTELALEGQYPECYVISSNCECLVAIPPPSNKSFHRILSNTDQCEENCIEPPHSVEQAKIAITIISICILTLFLFELLFHLSIIGFYRFFTNLFLVLDFIIILVSLGLESYLLYDEISKKNIDPEIQAVTIPLIIFSRSWRLLRIGHGTYKEAHDFYGETIRNLKEQIHELEIKLENNNNNNKQISLN